MKTMHAVVAGWNNRPHSKCVAAQRQSYEKKCAVLSHSGRITSGSIYCKPEKKKAKLKNSKI
jgi:hypothetical protein